MAIVVATNSPINDLVASLYRGGYRPVDFRDRKHTDDHTGEALSNAVNSPADAGSPHNLYLEMSYGQLNMYGDVPSAEIASADAERDRAPDRPSVRT